MLGVLAAGTVIVFTYRPTGHAAVEAPEPGPLAVASPATARRASPDEIRAYLNDMFDRLDRNGSGSIEPGEAPHRQVMSTRLADGSVRQWPLTQAEWFAQGDGNRDGRVTRSEYFSRLLPPVQSMFGVPESWQPGDGKRPARIAPPD